MKLRFSIRDLLWLTLMVALVLGWWIDRSHVAAERDAILAPHTQSNYDEFVGIAGIAGDPVLAKRLRELLQKAGITAIIEGSVVYGVSVAPEKQGLAIEILKKDSAAKGYWIEF